ncbi:MAG: alpha/beta fold hydrolase [Vicinamibacterales bacterium]
MTRVQMLAVGIVGALWAAPVHAQATLAPTVGDYVVRDFTFASGQMLPEVRLHYRTLGRIAQDARGETTNAVLIMHGTGGTGEQFLSANFANELFGPGQLFDVSKYFIVLPDGVGHGGSSKPSDGLHARFPNYTYDDMIELQYRLLTEHLHVTHLYVVMGTSMGGMHTWMWGERYPTFMDALVPLASVPVEIAGRNRIMRTMIRDAITSDPAWRQGEYTSPPAQGLKAAVNILLMMTSSPLQWHKQGPTRSAADAFLEDQWKRRISSTDANDMLYQFDASRTYDPSPLLDRIVAPLIAINSADDVVNPPELGLMERVMPRVKRGEYVLIPTSDATRGHGTHTQAVVWKERLAAFLATVHRVSPSAP